MVAGSKHPASAIPPRSEAAEHDRDKTLADTARLLQRVAAYLDGNGWKYSACEGSHCFEMDVGINSGSLHVTICCAAVAGLERLQVYARYPVRVPNNRLIAVAEGLARANYGMSCSTLEMDFSDGEVSVKSGIAADANISDRLIDHALDATLQTAEKFLGPLLSIAYGNAAPETILELVSQAAS